MSSVGSSSSMIVDILPAASQGTNWTPVEGPEARGLELPPDARDQILSEALTILGKCVSPNARNTTQTGLVVGYVQSGKTTGFTTLAALARDNGYRMVIIIGGTTKPLFGQNRDRLVRALRLETRPRNLPWRHMTQPRTQEQAHIAIRDALCHWELPSATPEERRTIIITVMKHHQHLQHLIDVFHHIDMSGVPTLLIDDEGDQAGLNTLVNQGDQSTTYRCILALKRLLPVHSYLQFTATPQAPLLINLVDVLSPSFAEILTPGAGYVGGHDFFVLDQNLVRDIPTAQIPGRNVVLNAPPETLLESMRLFFVGVAVGYISGEPEDNCSMMVHPSQRRDPHQQFFGWVSTTRTEWLSILDLPQDDQDYMELLSDFQQAYDDIADTLPNPPTFAQVQQQLRRAISQTEIREVNARQGRTPEIKWGEFYSWILVGGSAMDRGFTVEGLTVTYLPRSIGLGNADTVQQRARFFGYKRSYLGLCRIFIGPDARRAFVDYVDHEEDIRNELAQFSLTGRPLSDWRREFFLSRQLRPTRDNVIDIAYQRLRFGNEWVYPEGPHDSDEAVIANHSVFNSFRAAHVFRAYDGLDTRQNSRRNLVLHEVLLEHVHEQLLTRFRVSRLEDSQELGALLRLVQLRLMETPGDRCTVFLMAEGIARRRAYEDDKINQLFQGRQYATENGQRIITYPGDREIRAAIGLTVQMGYLNLGPEGALIAENIPHIAVWVPAEMARDTVLQPQGGGT